MREALGRLSKGVLAALGAYGTLVTLGLLPIPAALVAIAIGQLSGSVVPMAAALVASLLANVVLVLVLTRRRPQFSRARRRGLRAVGMAGDLGSLALTGADLESLFSVGLALARERVGPDAVARFDRLHVGDWVHMGVYGSSVAASKGYHQSIAGLHKDDIHMSVWRDDNAKATTPAEPLWRSDDSWRELVRQSWIRERPGRAECELDVVRDKHGNRVWKAIYRGRLSETEYVEDRAYRLIDGDLTRVDRLGSEPIEERRERLR